MAPLLDSDREQTLFQQGGQYVRIVKLFHAAQEKFDVFAYSCTGVSSVKTEVPHQLSFTMDE